MDNNGFLIISEDLSNAGKFFGQIEGGIFKALENEKIFKKIKVTDFQAICFETVVYESPANMILTPFKLLSRVFNSILSKISLALFHLEINLSWSKYCSYAMPYLDLLHFFLPKKPQMKNIEQPKACYKESYVYQLDESALHLQKPFQGILSHCHESDCRRFPPSVSQFVVKTPA